MLALLRSSLADLAGMRLVRVVPGAALQLTDGPQDSLEAYDQPHLVISRRPAVRSRSATAINSPAPR